MPQPSLRIHWYDGSYTEFTDSDGFFHISNYNGATDTSHMRGFIMPHTVESAKAALAWLTEFVNNQEDPTQL